MPYPESIETVGYLKPQEIVAIHMPRKAFMEEVRLLADNPRFEAIADRMVATAESMPRFPLGEWIDTERGCGCVVGEALVAADLLPRSEVAAAEWPKIRDLMRSLYPEDSSALEIFGNEIDLAVRDHLRAAGNVADSQRCEFDEDGYEISGSCRDVVVVIED